MAEEKPANPADRWGRHARLGASSSKSVGYYILLRIVVCGIFVFLAMKAHDLKHAGWVWVLSITAVVYNPIVQVHLNRQVWSVVNVATIGLLIATVFVLREKTI